jgi:hypothetical protein
MRKIFIILCSSFLFLIQLKGQENLERIHVIDSLIENNDFLELPNELMAFHNSCSSCADSFLISLRNFMDTLLIISKGNILNKEFVNASNNINTVDDINYFILKTKLIWSSYKPTVTKIRCSYNEALRKEFVHYVNAAYNTCLANGNINTAAENLAQAQFYRFKFYKDVCFNAVAFDTDIKKMLTVSRWIEKKTLELKQKQYEDSRPEWVKKGMTFEQYQEWWAQRLRAGSPYVGGSCSNCGKTLYRGKRGGVYYINSNGNKTYVPR